METPEKRVGEDMKLKDIAKGSLRPSHGGAQPAHLDHGCCDLYPGLEDLSIYYIEA